LKNLPNWGLLSANQQQDFLYQIQLTQPDRYPQIIAQVEQVIYQAKKQAELLAKTTAVSQEIDNFLHQDPPVQLSELEAINRNWKNEVNNASDIGIINQIKDRVWANIASERAKKNLKSELTRLIKEGQEAVRANDLTKLQAILGNIAAYQNISSSTYQEKKAEIDQLEEILIYSDLSKYQQFIVCLLQKELVKEPFIVTIEELDETNRDFAQKVNQLTEKKALGVIRDNVLDNINKKRTEKLVIGLLNKISQKFTSEEELSAVRQEVYRLKESKNKWEKNSWEQNKDLFIEFLMKNFEPKPQKEVGESSQPNYWLPVSIILLVSGLAIAVFIILRWSLGKLAEKKKEVVKK
jgi:hypothetical protein